MNGKSVALHTLGCKVNQVESEALRDEFIRRGWEVVDFKEPAAVYVINSCTVTHVSDSKSRALLRRALRVRPPALVVLTGCMAALEREDWPQGIGLIVGNRDKPRIAELVERMIDQPVTAPLRYVEAPAAEDKLCLQPHHQRGGRSRAFVKIQDGCESFCSYCIVPHVRGPLRSKRPEDVWAELEQLLALGYHEMVLTGIHTGHYGADLPGWDLARLLAMLLRRLPDDCRLRLSSIEPTEFRPELIALLTEERRICRHFHIPLQSGSDSVLASMGRPYRREDYRRLVEELARRVPDAAFTADVMVGYPGESEADFNDTYDLLAALPISDLHVFKYSRRDGTPAAAMPNQVGEESKAGRSSRLIALGQAKRQDFIRRQAGSIVVAVMERELEPGRWLGLSDNYIELVTEAPPGTGIMPGSLQAVKMREGEKNGGLPGAILL